MRLRLRTSWLIAPAILTLLLAAPAAFAGYSSAVLDDSPVSYWRLNESSGATTADDEQDNFDGDYQTGTDAGAAGPRPGDGFAGFSSSNGAATLNTSNPGYIATELNSAAVGDNYPFTTEIWFNTTASGTNNMLIISDESAGQELYGLGVKDGEVRAFAFSGGDFDPAVSSTTNFNDGNWHYAAAVFEDIEDQGPNQEFKVSLFVDPQSTSPEDSLIHGEPFATDADGTNIGALVRNADDSNGQGKFNGRLDEPAVYSTALSGTQIKSHFDAAVIPEPASLALLAPAGLLLLRRRRAA